MVDSVDTRVKIRVSLTTRAEREGGHGCGRIIKSGDPHALPIVERRCVCLRQQLLNPDARLLWSFQPRQRQHLQYQRSAFYEVISALRKSLNELFYVEKAKASPPTSRNSEEGGHCPPSHEGRSGLQMTRVVAATTGLCSRS